MSDFNLTSTTSRTHLSVIGHQTRYAQELCRLSTEVLPHWKFSAIINQVDRFLNAFAGKYGDLPSDQEKINALIQFFFQDQSFRVLDSKEETLRGALLLNTLASKTGPIELLTILFLALADSIHLKIKTINDRDCCLLKVYIENQSQILDFHRQGHFLEPFEIVDFVNDGVDFTQWNNGENLFIRYLYRIRKLARADFNLHGLAIVQSYLMRYQPFNLKHLSERAKIAYQTGDYRRAAEDIRDYFIYKSPDITNFQLKKIYKLSLKKQRDHEDH